MFKLLAALAVTAPLLTSCLPGDTRPEPGNVLTTVTGSDSTRDGFTTADGWTLSFDRALVSAGPMQLGDDCDKYAEYSEPGYDRILELTGPPKQKLSIMFGLGQCDIDFQVSPPSEDAVRGSGVSQADKDFMRTAGTDAWISNDGIALQVVGSATDGARTLGFSWGIRQSLFFVSCRVEIDGTTEAGLDLRGGEGLEYDLLIETEGLFRDDIDRETAALRFSPFANADTDADGTIALDELDAVPLDELRATSPYGGAPDDVTSLGDYVYWVLWPTLLRYRDTGRCDVSFEED